MIEIAMLPSIVRETAVMIDGMIRWNRSDPPGASRLSTAANMRGMSMMRNRVRKMAVTRLRTSVKPETATPITPPAASPIASAICLTSS